MSTLQVDNMKNFAGTGDPILAGTAKSYGAVSGDGVLTGALNVASVTKLGGGIFTIVYKTPAPTDFYSVQFTSVVQVTANIQGRATTNCQVALRNMAGQPTDLPFTFLAHW